MNCVNTSTSTFKELAKRNNVSESKLELIVHQYWLEDEGNTEFPSDVYIQAQLGNTKYREPSKAVREVWKTKYSKPQEFSSLKEVQQAVTEAQKFFPPSVIVYYKNNNGTFTLSVRQPVASLKHSINDFFKEGTSLDAGHFRTPLKGNQREQLFNIHDSIKRQLMFMEEDQVKETLKTQIQNSDIPKEIVEKISSAIDKMTKKQILSEIDLMDREQEDFNIVLQDLREAGESIRFQQEKQEPASAIEDEIQFSMDSPKHTFTFADGTVVETPFKLNDQQADALNAMNAFLHSNEAVMTLSGYAGTGKTSLMEILADKAKKDGVSIKFTASTNKAAKVLKNRVFEKGFFAQTLHKLFAYELAQDETTEYDAKKHITTRLEENAKYRPGDVIVIDEASMINDDLYRDIVQDAKNNRLKIIFVGDKKQLAPVGQKTISSVFKNSQSKVVELTKVERTGDNAILAEATRLRTDLPLTGISSFNSKGQGVAYMSKQKREELEKIIRYFAPNIKANPDYFRILAWSNNVVSEYNNMVRSILGYSSYIPQVGEPMMGYINWGYKRNASPMEDPYDLVNSESYKVVAVGNPQTLKKSFVRVADGKDVTVEIESIPITLENSVGEVKNFDYIDVKQNAKNRNSAIILAQQKADLWNKYRTAPRGRADTYGTKGWYAARAGEIERFLFVNDDITKSNPRDPNKPITLQAKVIDFGYAMTVHKSQGSTFTHVLVDDVNISKASGFEDTAPSTSSAEVSSEDLKTANETIEPVGPKKKLNIPGLANLLSKKSSQPETLISTPAPKAAAKVDQERADIVQQLKYVAVSRATDTVTIISDNVKKEDSPLNHINGQNKEELYVETPTSWTSKTGKVASGKYIGTKDSDGFIHIKYEGQSQARLKVNTDIIQQLHLFEEDIIGGEKDYNDPSMYKEVRSLLYEEGIYIDSVTIRPNGEVSIALTDGNGVIEGMAAIALVKFLFPDVVQAIMENRGQQSTKVSDNGITSEQTKIAKELQLGKIEHIEGQITWYEERKKWNRATREQLAELEKLKQELAEEQSIYDDLENGTSEVYINEYNVPQIRKKQTIVQQKNNSNTIQQLVSTISEIWQKAQAIQEPSGRRPVEYISPGQPARTYYVEGEHIYNDKGKEVYNAPQMRTHKNKILFKLAYKEGRAVIVNLKGNRYIVDKYQNILSVKTGEVMIWGDENGDRRDILALAENSFRDKLNTTQTSPQQPQQSQPQQTTTQKLALPGPETKINIYAGTGENADLSNFAERPFTIPEDFWLEVPSRRDISYGTIGLDSSEIPNNIKYRSVEAAFQGIKSSYSETAYPAGTNFEALRKQGKALRREDFAKMSGSEAKSNGRKITDLDRESWDKDSSVIMKALIKLSFEQNPQALQRLLATGNATLTHTQDKGKWGTEFPKLLMEVREELRKEHPELTTQQVATQQSTPAFYEGKITPDANTVFVFGSNPEGRHGAGAALTARKQFGAIYGQGEGLQGNSYALPTKDLRVKENRGLRSISPKQITENIKKMYEVARQNPNKQFKVAYTNGLNEATLNGYTGAEMIKMFKDAGPIPSNVVFSKNWIDHWNEVQSTPQQQFQHLTITPAQIADKKATAKGSISNKFIGFGEGIAGSSTAEYARQAGDKANVGEYNSQDTIFVSIPGLRGNEQIRHREQQKTIDEALKALKAGATLITDNSQYTESSTYNEGEKALAKALKEAGAIYRDRNVEGVIVGEWKLPLTQQQQSQQTFTTETALGDKVQVNSIEQALAIQQLYEMFDEMEESKFEGLKNKILNASPKEVSKINIPMSSAARKHWNDRKQEVQQQIQQESKDVQSNSPQQSQPRSLGEKETVSQAMEKTVKTLDDWLEYSRAHIKVDKESHKYYIDGKAADYSVTEYAESVFGKPVIKGDYSHSSAVGNTADAVYRDYFDSTKDVYALNYPNTNAERKAKMIQDAQRFEAYLDKVHGVKDGVRQYKVITREFPIAARFDTPDGMKTIAGTMDMIVIDKNGDIWIYDFKAKNHPITQTYYGKEVSDRRNYTAQQNLYRAILDANSAFEGQVKGLNLVWMDTAYPKLSEAQYKTDKKTGEVTVVVADGRTLNIPLAEYDGFKTPSLKPNIEDSIIPLDITDDIENLHIPELHAMDFIARQVIDYIKSLGIPVHTREELIQYLKDHGYENIQQAFEEQREMQDIRERAIKNGQIKLKADGSFDYALAPNGKRSNLNERQWLQVRTQAFKKWFGDWERVAKNNLGESIGETDIAHIINKDGSINFDKLEEITDKYFNTADESLFAKGRKTLRTRKEHHVGENNTLEHLQNVAKSASKINIRKDLKPQLVLAAALHDLAKPFHRGQKHGFQSVSLINKLFKGDISKLVKFAVRHHMLTVEEGVSFTQQDADRIMQDAIDNEINTKDAIELLLALNTADILSGKELTDKDQLGKTKEEIIKTEIPQKRLLLEKALNNIFSSDVSKVVDENGEPLVVYHGSKTQVSVFDPSKSDTRYKLSQTIKPTNFFSDDRTVADAFAKTEKQSIANAIGASFNEVEEAQVEDEDEVWQYVANSVNKPVDWVKNFWLNELSFEERMDASDGSMYDYDVEKQKYAVFLNMRDPVIIDAQGERADKVLEDNKDIINNNDEVIIKNIDETVGKKETATDYLVRQPNQIKSATDNIGTFSTENDDIQMMAEDNNKLIQTLKIIEEAIKTGNWTDNALEELENLNLDNYGKILKRFSQEELRSSDEILAQAETIITRGNGRTNASNPSSNRERTEQQEQQIETWAKENGLWYNDYQESKDGSLEGVIEADGGIFSNRSGSESLVYWMNDGTAVKAIDASHYEGDLQGLFDKIMLHNSLFPETSYTVLGFGRDRGNTFRLIVKQKFVKGTVPTDAEIQKFAKDLELEKRGGWYYTKDGKRITDLNQGNVIKVGEKTFLVIDCDVEFTREHLNNLQEQETPFYLLKTPKGDVEIYGFIDPETLDMYLDDVTINPEHPIHEYTHLWDRALYGMDPEHKLWNQGVKLMKQLKLWKEIENSEQYGQKWKKKGISEEKLEFLIGSEVHSRLVGKEGEALLERIANEEGQKGLIGKLKEWILSAWQALKGLMSDWSDEDIQNLTLEDFTNMVVKDLADGVIPQMVLKNQAEERSTAEQEGRSSNMETNGTQEKPEILSLPNFENLINNQQPIELTPSELWKVPLLEKLDDSISDSNTDEKNQEIIDEITTLIQSVTEDEYKQNTKKIKKTQEKINEYKRLNDQVNALKGNNLRLESYEIRHVAEQVVDSISDIITELQSGKSTIKDLFPDFKTDFNPKGASRVEIVTKIGIDNFINLTQERMRNAVKGNAKSLRDVAQFALLTKNWEALMTFAQDQFVANEGFGVRKSHTKKGFDVDADAKIDLTNAEDDRNDTDGVREVEGDAQEHWQVVFRTIDILNSMSEKVRMALHECYKIDKNGNHVMSKWGIPERVDKREAVQSIIRWTQGALNLNQMIEKLAAQQEKNPWLNQLLVKLRDKNQSDFQSQFFGVMNKHFQLYSIVRLKNGKYVSMFINEHPAQTELMQSVKAMHKMGNHPLFTNSGINTENLGFLHSYLDELNKIALDLREREKVLKRKDTKAVAQLTEEGRQKAFQCLSAASKMLGFMIPDEAWDYAITGQNLRTYGSDRGMVEYLNDVVKSLDNVVKNKQKDYDPFKFKGENNISGSLGNFLKFVTDHMDNTTSSSFYDDGNMYQSYVIPSFMTKLMSKFHGTPKEVEKFINEEYGKSEWFFDKKNNRWRINWLQRALKASSDGVLSHKVELNFNKHSYMRTMTDAEYAVSLLSEYVAEASKGKTGEFLAWFRVPMLSNKPSSEFIRFYAFTGMNYQNDILDGMLDIFEQELSRIQTVRMRNKKKGDPGFIKNWDTNGRKFCFLPFLNEHLAENSSGELANLLKKKLEGKKELSAEQEKRLSDLVKEQIRDHIDKRVKSIMEEWDAMGIMKAAEKVDNLGDNEEAIRNKVKEFLWNDTFASKMILQLTIGDIAFYKDAEDLQKRLAQIHAPGIRANVDAIDYAGNRVSADGKYRTFIIKDFDDFKSNIIANISEVFNRKIARARNDQERKSLEALKDSLVRQRTYKADGSVDDPGGAYWNINVADAQGYSSPTSYRKKAFMFGKWSREAEDIYQRLLNGDYDYTSLKVAFQPLKPFVYSRIEKSTDVAGAPITKIYSPFQAKNAEYLLIMADAIMRGEENKTGALSRPNLLKAIYDIMEDSAYDDRERDEEGKIINQGTYNGKGIDTVQFESAIKSTLQSPINLHQFANKENGEREAYKHIRGIIYKNGKNTNKVKASDYDTTNSVHEVAFEDYCLQQEVPEHFKNHEQAHGSQIRMIIPSDLDYYYDPNRKDKDAEDNIVYYNVKQPDGKIKRYTASEFRAEYEKLISQNIEESLKDLAEELHLHSNDKKERNIILSEFLQREIVDSPRYGIDLFQACSVDENGEFRIPLGDPIQAKRIEQLINSLIKNRINKQKLPGGPVVQVSNFGTSKTLHIRFKDKAGNIIPLEDEYNPSEHDGKSYKQYLEENQAGIAYAEVYASIWSDELVEKFGRPDGTIDIAAIEKLDSDLLTMVSYRIPTEDKYSCLPMKIVGFLPREAGEAIMLPYELTTIDGSDFDVDKRYIMRKDIRIIEDKKVLKRMLTTAARHMYKGPQKELENIIYEFLKSPNKLKDKDDLHKYLYEELQEFRNNKAIPYTTFHDTTGRRARNNQIIDMTLAVLTHERTADKILNPGGFDEQKEMGYMVSAYKNPNNKKSWKELDDIAKGKDGISELKKLSYVEKDLTWADTQVHFYHQNNAGSSLIGVFAVNKVAHATLGDDNIKANINYICGRAFNIAGFKFENDATGGMRIDPMYDTEGNLIGKTLGSLVGASADTAKDPVLDLMNINMETAGMLTTMLRMGMPFRDAALFLSQDIITKALAEHSKRKLEKYISIESVVQEWVSKYESNNKITDDSHIHEEELTREELIKGLKGKESLSSRYKVMKNFLRIKALANAMRRPTFATRFNSISSAVGPLVVDNLILEHKMEDYAMNPNFKEEEDQHQFIYEERDKDGKKTGKWVGCYLKDVFGLHPILNSFSKTVGMAHQMFEKDMPACSDSFKEVLNTIAKLHGSGFAEKFFKNKKLLDQLSLFYQSAMLVQGGLIDPSKLNYYIEDFPKDFMDNKYKEKYADNALINAIRPIPSSNTDRTFLTISLTGLTSQEKERLSSAWDDLHKKDPKLSQDLFNYCFFRAGIGFSPKTFISLVDTYVKENLSGTDADGNKVSYVDIFRQMPSMNPEVLIDLFMRNNWDNKRIVPAIKTEEMSFIYSADGIEVHNDADKEKLIDTPYFTTEDRSGKTHLWKYEGERFDRLVYREVKLLGDNNEYVVILKDSKQLPTIESTGISEDTVNPDIDNSNIDGSEAEIQYYMESNPTEESEMSDDIKMKQNTSSIARGIAETSREMVMDIPGLDPSKVQRSEDTSNLNLSRFSKILDAVLQEQGVTYDEKKVKEELDKYC